MRLAKFATGLVLALSAVGALTVVTAIRFGVAGSPSGVLVQSIPGSFLLASVLFGPSFLATALLALVFPDRDAWHVASGVLAPVVTIAVLAVTNLSIRAFGRPDIADSIAAFVDPLLLPPIVAGFLVAVCSRVVLHLVWSVDSNAREADS